MESMPEFMPQIEQPTDFEMYMGYFDEEIKALREVSDLSPERGDQRLIAFYGMKEKNIANGERLIAFLQETEPVEIVSTDDDETVELKKMAAGERLISIDMSRDLIIKRIANNDLERAYLHKKYIADSHPALMPSNPDMMQNEESRLPVFSEKEQEMLEAKHRYALDLAGELFEKRIDEVRRKELCSIFEDVDGEINHRVIGDGATTVLVTPERLAKLDAIVEGSRIRVGEVKKALS